MQKGRHLYVQKLTYSHMRLVWMFLCVVKYERAGESALPVAMRWR